MESSLTTLKQDRSQDDGEPDEPEDLLLRGRAWCHDGHRRMLAKSIDGSYTGTGGPHQSVFVKPPRCAYRRYKRMWFEL